MATSDAELRAEVRDLTNYDSALISDSDFDELIAIAKEEMDAEVPASDRPISYYGSDTHEQDRALFWLTCLFAKIKAGEIAAARFSIADLEQAPLDGQANLWMQMFQRRRGQMSIAPGFASSSLARDDERDYSYE